MCISLISAKPRLAAPQCFLSPPPDVLAAKVLAAICRLPLSPYSAGRVGGQKKHLSEALTRCDTGRAAGVRSCTAGPLQAPRGINVTALHFHLSPDWPRRSEEERQKGWGQADGGEAGPNRAERSRQPTKTVKCFQTRTVEQRRFGWCLISGGWGRGGGVCGGVARLFSLLPRPHMVGSCQSGKTMKKKS